MVVSQKPLDKLTMMTSKNALVLGGAIRLRFWHGSGNMDPDLRANVSKRGGRLLSEIDENELWDLLVELLNKKRNLVVVELVPDVREDSWRVVIRRGGKSSLRRKPCPQQEGNW